ncbi:restriction endonuclease subunit S [Novosphingobium sp. BW1]|uniref:restriction endonuclease subunit S n=1 Tax=Novosphingobium sp. BW1 TaxID=2592621 RepID=UPI0011DEEB1B|nr:restriction endonuclease subunit S [Novosphingobium sp. BW1]TYC93926.1 restriction endonuclease subunit S [Novosphingobium sp. BW1]
MIPEGWERVSLGDIAQITGGKRLPKGRSLESDPTPHPYIRVSDMRMGKLDVSAIQYLPADLGPVLKRYRVNAGDLLISVAGTLGAICRVPDDLDGANLTENADRISSFKCDSGFLFHALMDEKLQQAIQSSRTTNAQPKLALDKIRSFTIPLPPKEEQRRIALVLETWDRAIETVEALIANARAQKLALMQQLLPQGTTPPKKRLPGFSGDWRKLHIGDVAKEVSERAGDEAGYPVLSCSKYDGMVESLSYFKKKVYSDDTSNYKVMRRGTFGFPSNHVEEGSIGYQDLCDAGIVSPIYCVFATSNEVDDGFLFKLLKTDRYRQIFAAATNASVDRRGSLRWKEFSRIPLPLPPLEEQRAISEAVDAVAATETAYQAQLAALRQEKAALMQQLLTGKRRVKLLESEVA